MPVQNWPLANHNVQTHLQVLFTLLCFYALCYSVYLVSVYTLHTYIREKISAMGNCKLRYVQV